LRGRIAVQISQNLGDLLWQMGKLNQAKDILEKALEITEQHVGRPDTPYCGFIYVLLGRILHQRDELSEAEQIIKKGFPYVKIGICLKSRHLATSTSRIFTGLWESILKRENPIRERSIFLVTFRYGEESMQRLIRQNSK